MDLYKLKNETTAKIMEIISASKDEKERERSISEVVSKAIEGYSSESVKSNSHYLLSKFTHVIAKTFDYQVFQKILNDIGYEITRHYKPD